MYLLSFCFCPTSIGATDPPQPFELLLNGEFLRTTLDKFIYDHQLASVRFEWLISVISFVFRKAQLTNVVSNLSTNVGVG